MLSKIAERNALEARYEKCMQNEMAWMQDLPHTLTKINHACGKSGLQKFDLPQVRLNMVSWPLIAKNIAKYLVNMAHTRQAIHETNMVFINGR